MLKFIAAMPAGGRLYGFGLSEGNLNRLQFNQEPIFFDFGYDGKPELFGLILYMERFSTALELAADLAAVRLRCQPFLDSDRGVTPASLRVFPFPQEVMERFRRFRDTPIWGFETKVQITDPKDCQIFFSGRTEQELAEMLREMGLVGKKTKRTHKGFGPS